MVQKVKVLFLEDFNDYKKDETLIMDKDKVEYLLEIGKPLKIIDEEKEKRTKEMKIAYAKNQLEARSTGLGEIKAVDLSKYDYEQPIKERANMTAKELGIDEETFEQLKEIKPKKKNDLGYLKHMFEVNIRNKNIDEATELIVQYILDSTTFYTTKEDNKNEIWYYDDGIYLPNGASHIQELTRKILQEKYNQFFYNQIKNKIESDTFIDPKNFFINQNIDEIPILDGIFNIKTRKLRPFNPKDIFFNKLPVHYDAGANCPMIEKFLDDIFPDKNDKEVYYEMGGFCLLKEYKFEKAFMLVGNGRNGKGKSIILLKKIIGESNIFSLPLSAIRIDNADVSQLFGKMVNLAGDIGNTDLKETGLFKSLTGRDSITIRRKYLNAITFVNYAKFIFGCNELPMVYDTSKGFWDRWVLLNFPFTFEDELEYEKEKNNNPNIKLRDEDIVDKISTPEEISGLFNKFLDGLDRLLKNRRFSSTRGTDEIKTMWIRMANSFMAFCYDNLENDYNSLITKKELRKRYAEYCKKHKLKTKSDIVIKRVLQEEYGASEERNSQTGEWNWVGVTWK